MLRKASIPLQGGPKKVSPVNFSNELGQASNHIQLFSNKLATEVQETVSCSMSLAFSSIPHSFEILARDTFSGLPCNVYK
jgi:hypothetical protein